MGHQGTILSLCHLIVEVLEGLARYSMGINDPRCAAGPGLQAGEG